MAKTAADADVTAVAATGVAPGPPHADSAIPNLIVIHKPILKRFHCPNVAIACMGAFYPQLKIPSA